MFVSEMNVERKIEGRKRSESARGLKKENLIQLRGVFGGIWWSVGGGKFDQFYQQLGDRNFDFLKEKFDGSNKCCI
jgi:hypothetical protein